MTVKVCGMTDAENIRQVEEAGADFIGLIFYPKSPRCVPAGLVLPSGGRARRVGVFVNSEEDNILDKVSEYALDYVQLHGDESPLMCKSLKNRRVGVIKAFRASSDADLDEVTAPYAEFCDFFLFDTPCSGYGGSGKGYDWSLLEGYHGRVPFLLSGGLNPGSAGALEAFSHPFWAGVDLNSGFETSPGIKDILLLRDFIKWSGSLQ